MTGFERFREGEYYRFIIDKTVLMPDHEEYYLFKDHFNNKHLILKNLYADYHFFPGQFVQCRIDKINCSGKIFIEPQNPYYESGNRYLFPVKASSSLVNSFGDKENLLIVSDKMGNDISVSSDYEQLNPPKELICTIERIKRGRLYLNSYDYKYHKGLVQFSQYKFTITGILTLAGNTEYFVIMDPFGYKHIIRKKYYDHFNFHKEQEINGLVTETTGQYIEVENPVYRTGEVYEFQFAGFEEVNWYNKQKEYILTARDKFGITCPVTPLSHNFHDWLNLTTIYCRVERFRRGKLYLTQVDKYK
ncbi:MAG: hypothetical protein NTW49_00325 [Bacteroidia bacterium]|nr:hypothetical protein [Bacteroidia bacterium]